MKNKLLFLAAALAVGASLFLVQPTSGQTVPYGRPGTATATAGAATLNSQMGVVTSESLVTAAGANYTLTLTCSYVKSATSVVLPWLSGGSNTAGLPQIITVTPAAGSVAIVVKNQHASAALNGTIRINYVVLFGD